MSENEVFYKTILVLLNDGEVVVCIFMVKTT